jgi:hypothetical protein
MTTPTELLPRLVAALRKFAGYDISSSVPDGVRLIVDTTAGDIREARTLLAEAEADALAQGQPDSLTGGYVDAFYEIGKMLGIPALPVSPKEAFETHFKPKLRALLAQGQSWSDFMTEELAHTIPPVAQGQGDGGEVTLNFWSDQMLEAETIFRRAGKKEYAKGIEYARKTAVRLLAAAPQPAGEREQRVTDADVELACVAFHQDRGDYFPAQFPNDADDWRGSIRAAIESFAASHPASGQPGKATASKLAYYQTHEPPHCPTCDCAAASTGEPTAQE